MALFPAAALALAIRVLDADKTSLRQLWTPTLHYYTSYSIEAISEAVSALAKLLMDATTAVQSGLQDTGNKKKLRAVSKKYSNKKYMKIALLPVLQDDIVRQIAEDGEI